ncbi:hypothetical protein BOX15_Mlig025097g1 [Macrostomum lignano]|uniref:Uncharacterized protein n=1 Tax=Macrostomum lignano TaxID=282301 RepID=A0A267EMF7_9PLAT|nr:hypothetical protein BOX15_Mlig025097g1 [Macrostomum lignano]
MRNHCRLFTVFLHDSCQLATRLFRSGRCSQIKIDCDEELIRNVFIRLDRDVGIRFTCWFLTLCTKSLFNIESVNPPMSPMSLFDAEYKTVFRKKLSEKCQSDLEASGKPVCIFYSDSEAYIQSISRNNSTASPAWPGICLSPVLCRWPADEISELVDRPLPELVLTLEQEQKADRKHGGIEIMLIPCATFLAFLDEFNDEQPDETVDFMTMMNRRIGDAIVEWAFSNISREIIRRDDLTPAELHKLRMRLALLAVLCYNFCDTENPTESADSGAYFRKLFELLNRICCPTEPLKVNLNSDIQRPRVLSWSVRANKRSAARSAARTSSGSYVWELILEGTENKILLQFPEDYIKKRVVIAIQYLAMCDCSGLFKKLADRWDYFEYPCIIEFMRLKKNVGEEVKPPTHFSEYICLIKMSCMNSNYEFYEASRESIDFSLVGQTENRQVSVKSYHNRDADLLRISRIDEARCNPERLYEMAKKHLAEGNGHILAVLYNCEGDFCRQSDGQLWKRSDLKYLTCGCREDKMRFLMKLEEELAFESSEDCFIPGHIYFDLQFGMYSFQQPQEQRTGRFHLRELLAQCFKDLVNLKQPDGTNAETVRKIDLNPAN